MKAFSGTKLMRGTRGRGGVPVRANGEGGYGKPFTYLRRVCVFSFFRIPYWRECLRNYHVDDATSLSRRSVFLWQIKGKQLYACRFSREPIDHGGRKHASRPLYRSLAPRESERALTTRRLRRRVVVLDPKRNNGISCPTRPYVLAESCRVKTK